MAKFKSFVKQTKAKKKAEQTLETADDYLAAGVEHEDGAGKWRAGDAAKSMRFFTRAIEVYNVGLQKFPQSLDLAYNKARVQYEIATHPILVRQLQVPVLEALEATLESHRYALSLDAENADSLFNTAQVLTSIAEEILKDGNATDATALSLLEEALEMQNRCLAVQEMKLEEGQAQERAAAEMMTEAVLPDTTLVTDDDGSQTSEMARQEDQWASVVEPVTPDTLVDTIVAQLGTLAALCATLSSSPSTSPSASLPWVEEYSSNLLENKLPIYLGASIERHQEVALAKANFVSALLEAGFRMGKLDDFTYKRERDAVFAVAQLHIEDSGSALIANAYSLISFNSALAERPSQETESKGPVRWNALAAAIASLTKASKSADLAAEDLSKTHALRGDCSLLQLQLGKPPVGYQAAITNASQLLKNAEVFYRNAAKLTQDTDERDASTLRASVVWGIQKNDIQQAVASAVGDRDLQWKQAQLAEMVDEGLLSNELLST